VLCAGNVKRCSVDKGLSYTMAYTSRAWIVSIKGSLLSKMMPYQAAVAGLLMLHCMLAVGMEL
jgi:hypothetical protein